MACDDILMLLLAIAPDHVMLAPASSKDITQIWKLGRQLQWRVEWEALTHRATEAMERRLGSPAGATCHGAAAARSALLLLPGETVEDHDAPCIRALQSLQHGIWHWGHRLPRRVYSVLAENLPPDGLLPLLIRHSDIFWVDGNDPHVSFQVMLAVG